MSQYDDLYTKPNIDNLDKSWTDMWANTFMVKNSNILSLMFPVKEGATNKTKKFFKNIGNKAFSFVKSNTGFITNDNKDDEIQQLKSQLTTMTQSQLTAAKIADDAQKHNRLLDNENKTQNDRIRTLTTSNNSLNLTNSMLTTDNENKHNKIKDQKNRHYSDLDKISGITITAAQQADEISKFDQTSYDIINDQNITLESTIQNMNALYSTDDQKSLYQSEQNSTLNTAIYVLYFIYFALLIVIAFILVFNLPETDIYIRGAIMAAFILYPFLIGYIEIILYISWTYAYSILNGNVYTNGTW